MINNVYNGFFKNLILLKNFVPYHLKWINLKQVSGMNRLVYVLRHRDQVNSVLKLYDTLVKLLH